MARKHLTTTSGLPVLFNCNRLAANQDEQMWIEGLLADGKIVACPSEVGMVLWMRADRGLADGMAKLSEAVVVGSWAVGVSDSSHCLRYLEDSPYQEQVERLLSVYWPGPLVIRGVSKERWRTAFDGVFGRKLSLWYPFSPWCNIVIKSCDFPIIAGRLRLREELYQLTPRDVVDLYGVFPEIVMEGREQPGNMEFTVLDISGSMPRLVRRGDISSRDLEGILERKILLSGDAAQAAVGSLNNGVRLVVFEGDTERIVRRMRVLAENQEESGTVHYFLHSPTALEAFSLLPNVHRICGERQAQDISDPFTWQKIGTSLWNSIVSLERRQDVGLILVEGVPRREHTEEFMERLNRVAHQVVNITPPPQEICKVVE